MSDTYISSGFDADLVLRDGWTVQLQLNDAMEALSRFDMGLVEKVVDDEHRLNEMEVEIDAECGNISHGASPVHPTCVD